MFPMLHNKLSFIVGVKFAVIWDAEQIQTVWNRELWKCVINKDYSHSYLPDRNSDDYKGWAKGKTSWIFLTQNLMPPQNTN